MNETKVVAAELGPSAGHETALPPTVAWKPRLPDARLPSPFARPRMMDDVSKRVREAPVMADYVAARTRDVPAGCSNGSRSAPNRARFPIHEGNEASRAVELVKRMERGDEIVSDAGMPAVSDPGYRLIGPASTGASKSRCAALR